MGAWNGVFALVVAAPDMALTPINAALSYTNTARSLVANGVAVNTGSNFAGAMDGGLGIGGNFPSRANMLNGTVSRIRYFNTALPAATLQRLTA